MSKKFDGEMLKQLRIESNLKQTELAEIVGVGRDRICRWEKGEEPSFDKLQKLAKALEVRTVDLFYFTNKA